MFFDNSRKIFRMDSSFSERLRFIRERAGHTQESLAASCGMSRARISQMERGIGGSPTIETLDKIVKECNSSLIYLISGSSSNPSITNEFTGAHDKLDAILKSGHRQSIQDVIDAFYQVQSSAIVEKKPDTRDVGEVGPAPEVKSNVVPFDNNIDEPREVVEVYIPMWDYIAASPPDGSDPEFIGFWPVVRSTKKESHKVILVRGDSMEPEFRDGDILLVDYGKEPKKGDCVTAWIDGEGGTFKKFGGVNQATGMVKLIPYNKKHKVIERPAEMVRVTAVYVNTIRAKRGK